MYDERFSASGRILTLVLLMLALFFIDRPIDLAASGLGAILVGISLRQRSRSRVGGGRAAVSSMRTLVWLAPGLAIANALLGPAPRLWGIFSRAGLLTGCLVAYRLAWAAWMSVTLIRTCPPDELLGSFRSALRFLRIPDRGASTTVFLTLEMLPQFADIRPKDFAHLPERIADRIRCVVIPALPAEDDQRSRLVLADLALVLPAAGLVLLSVLT